MQYLDHAISRSRPLTVSIRKHVCTQPGQRGVLVDTQLSMYRKYHSDEKGLIRLQSGAELKLSIPQTSHSELTCNELEHRDELEEILI